MSDPIAVTLKWKKQVYNLNLNPDENSTIFKKKVEEITGVPVARQKLLAKQNQGWKGPLKDNVLLVEHGFYSSITASSSTTPTKREQPLVVTLIGSAETLSTPSPAHKITFLEDLSPQELQEEEDAKMQAAMATAEGMIQTLQLPPHQRRYDSVNNMPMEMYQYNRLVSGLPQRQIEHELKYGQGSSNNGELQGKVAMNLGLELRRAYVNDIAVLYDGTCVSVMDDGHVHMWKHAAQQKDIIHAPLGEGGVNSITALRQRQGDSDQGAAFATVGRAALYLWSLDGEPLLALPTGMQGTSPASLVSIFGGMNTMTHHSDNHHRDDDETITCLAARFQVTHHPNPSQFRLVPQNDDERRRRAQAEAHETSVRQALSRASRSVQIWFMFQGGGSPLRSKILELPHNNVEQTMTMSNAAITCLAVLSTPGSGKRYLLAGDSEGYLWVWKAQRSQNGYDIDFEYYTSYQVCPIGGGSRCTIVYLQALRNDRLAVSIDLASSGNAEEALSFSPPADVVIPVEMPRGVLILNLSSSLIDTPSLSAFLSGHRNDAVICMCQLPNGDLLTGGGKLDATLQLWDQKQIYGDGVAKDENEEGGKPLSESKKTLTGDVGYVFALAVLADTKIDSNYYAVAAARYNTIKLVI